MATHWLPKIIKEFQKDYPNIEYELLLGDYTDVPAYRKIGLALRDINRAPVAVKRFIEYLEYRE